jgi:hypothetical protein
MSTITPEGQKLLREVTTYKYFVSYFFDNGHGMIEMTMTLPIRSMEDVRGVAKEIKRVGKIKWGVVILNWILL